MTPHEQRDRFYQYLWPHRAVVLRTAYLLTHNMAEAEDLAQETLMRAFDKINQFDISSSGTSWLTAILRNVRIDRVRVKSHAILAQAKSLDGVMLASPEPFEETDSTDPQALLEQFSDQAIIDALHLLPEEIRWTLLLIDVQQMSCDDAAGILDVPPGTVRSRTHRGRRMLREQLLGDAAAATPVSSKAQRRIS